jgi:hypothetical protein
MPKPLGTYDPDEEGNPTIIRNSMLPKNALQTRAFKACGRTMFKSTEDRKRWRLLEDKTFGGEERHIMYKAWMEHNIGLCEQANAKTEIPTRTFVSLMKYIENENRRVDWESANREKIMTSRSSAIKSRFGRQSDD